MAIIIEGPDAAGKTTLGRMLRKQFGMELIVSAGAPTTDERLKEYCVMQVDALSNRNAVIDRVSPISHPIYNHPYVGVVDLTSYLHVMLDHPKTIMVYCRPPTDALMRPEKHEWKDYDTEEHKQKVLNNQMTYIERYDDFFRRVPHLAYDYTDETSYLPQLISMLAASVGNDDVLDKLREFHTLKC